MKGKKTKPLSDTALRAALGQMLDTPTPEPSTPTKKTYRLSHTLKKGQSRDDYIADFVTSGTLGNAALAAIYSDTIGGSDVEIASVHQEIKRHGGAVVARDHSAVESMLAAQVVSLNAIYTHLALIAQSNFTRSLDTSERCLRLAFKAQSQSRATAEAIAFIQNPSGAVFARQANVAHGPQQVNNGTTSQALAHAEHTETRPNELKRIEAAHDPMDTSASRTAGAVDLPMAPVGTRHRATKRRR